VVKARERRPACEGHSAAGRFRGVATKVAKKLSVLRGTVKAAAAAAEASAAMDALASGQLGSTEAAALADSRTTRGTGPWFKIGCRTGAGFHVPSTSGLRRCYRTVP
jgi:hypothetical protein